MKRSLARRCLWGVAFAAAVMPWAHGQNRFFRGGTSRSSGSSSSGIRRIGEAHFEVDPGSRSLIITTDAETNERIKQVLQTLDKPVPQALIKVLFLEVTHGNDRDIGVEFGYDSWASGPITPTGQATRSESTSGTRTTGTSVTNVTVPPSPNFSPRDQSFVSTLGDAVTSLTTASAGDRPIVRILESDLEVTIRAMDKVAKLEVLSRPSIMARHNEEATITIGQEVPFIRNSRITNDGQTINTIEYEDIGIILTVTPHITNSGLVELVVAPEISTLTGDKVSISGGIDAPVIAKRSAETHVVVPSGKTIVIGGLMEDQETESIQKVPILGDIWGIGALFRRKVTTKSKTELLIFLTPTIVEAMTDIARVTNAEKSNARLLPEAFDDEELKRYLPEAEE